MTPIHAVLTRVHAIFTPIHAVLTRIHAIFTLHEVVVPRRRGDRRWRPEQGLLQRLGEGAEAERRKRLGREYFAQEVKMLHRKQRRRRTSVGASRSGPPKYPPKQDATLSQLEPQELSFGPPATHR